jgi:hypothetical protein
MPTLSFNLLRRWVESRGYKRKGLFLRNTINNSILTTVSITTTRRIPGIRLYSKQQTQSFTRTFANTTTTNFNMSSYYSQQPAYKRSKSVKSDHEITLNGPLDVVGSVKSGSSINLNGDVIVREKLDAYGSIGLNGNITCE